MYNMADNDDDYRRHRRGQEALLLRHEVRRGLPVM
jgi:hypothetical protein